jgi:hypothetical protein
MPPLIVSDPARCSVTVFEAVATPRMSLMVTD